MNMQMKKTSVLMVMLLCYQCLTAQVNLQKGTVGYGIPLHQFADGRSGLSLSIGLQYNSGNGLRVDDLPTAAGSGWQLSGVSFVARVIRGHADDQMPRSGSIYDTLKHPPGYLYNGRRIADGCPVALTTYPIFRHKDEYYVYDNETMADREQDHFYYTINGRSGVFVIGKNGIAVPLNDSRLRIDIQHMVNTPGVRTSIGVITITDEQGIVYEFGQRENTRVYKYSPRKHTTFTAYTGHATAVNLEDPESIAPQYNPNITTAWYLTRMADTRNNRDIRFEYSISNYEVATRPTYQYSAPYQSNGGGTLSNPIHGITIRNNRAAVSHPDIAAIRFPDSTRLEFGYDHARQDLAGTAALTTVTLKDAEGATTYSYALDQTYFVKNAIRTPTAAEQPWARLCLKAVHKKGAGAINPDETYRFDYYTGSDTTENFVPPAYFPVRDPWGFYNGSYSGIPTDRFPTLNTEGYNSAIKLALYNDAANTGAITDAPDFKSTVKTGYARNGLLKSVTQPQGGVTEYEYEQNRIADNRVNGIDPGTVGGVHLSKTIARSAGNGNDIVTTYDYTDDNNNPSLWGIEVPHNRFIFESYYDPEDKYYIPTQGCNYTFKHPGNTKETDVDQSSTLQKIAQIYLRQKVNGTINQIMAKSKLLNQVNTSSTNWQAIALIIIFDIINCAQDQARSSHPVYFSSEILNFANTLPAQFRQVTVQTTGGGVRAGKTVHRFTSDTDFPLLAADNPFPYTAKPRGYDWLYGLPKLVNVYDNDNRLLHSTEQTYTPVVRVSSDAQTASCDCKVQYTRSMKSDNWYGYGNTNEFTTTTIPNKLVVEPYNIATGRVQLTAIRERTYDITGAYRETNTTYAYTTHNFQPSATVRTDNRGQRLETRLYYPEDYDLNLPAHRTLLEMRNSNIVNTPIATHTWLTPPGGQRGLVAATITEYGKAPNGDYRPVKSYTLQTDKPVPEVMMGGMFSPTVLVPNPALLPVTALLRYDSLGQLVQTTDPQTNRRSCTLYDYDNPLPVAAVTNAGIDEVAYSSFEGRARGNWMTQNETTTDYCPTGNRCLRLNYDDIRTTVSITRPYILSFWATNTAFTISGGLSPAITGPTINGWTFYQYRLPAGSAPPVIGTRNNNNCYIDELRLYPADATMVTTTYRPGVGKTSVCDANNRIGYMEYDRLGRLSKEKDERGNTLKTYEYHDQLQ